jgi:uncharacterized protein YybS (DUF2232 family)
MVIIIVKLAKFVNQSSVEFWIFLQTLDPHLAPNVFFFFFLKKKIVFALISIYLLFSNRLTQTTR